MIDLRILISSGVYFGHQKSRWCPKMAPYIWGHRSGIHLIDVSKTAVNLEKAALFLKGLAEQRKPILWVGTKQAAAQVILDIATKLDMPYIVHRWVGGLITNFPQVKKSTTKLLHSEDILAKSEDSYYTKKELSKLKKSVEKLNKTIGGVKKLTWPIGAIVVIDAKKEETAIKEAVQAGVPVVALVDTNSDPSAINFVIPGNDDSPKSIRTIVEYLASYVEQGKANAAKVKKEEEKEIREKEAKEIHGLRALEENDESESKNTKKKSAPKKIVKKIETE